MTSRRFRFPRRRGSSRLLRRYRPRTLLGAAVLGLVLLGALLLSRPATDPPAQERSAPPKPGSVRTEAAPAPAIRTVRLEAPPARVVDGDTFEADLDGDGQLQFPRERVRLLYVDTRETYDSGHGVDLVHGLPATAFLKAALATPPMELRIRADDAVGLYGRTLAEVFAQGRSVNLALVRAGHSALVTRYVLPLNLADYEAAEAEAFAARRGIWAQAASRRTALGELRREGRSVRAPDNPAWHSREEAVGAFNPAALEERFLAVRGRLMERRTLSKGVMALQLGPPEGAGAARLRVVAFAGTAKREAVLQWPLNGVLQLEGYLKRYRGKMELVLYRRLPEHS